MINLGITTSMSLHHFSKNCSLSLNSHTGIGRCCNSLVKPGRPTPQQKLQLAALIQEQMMICSERNIKISQVECWVNCKNAEIARNYAKAHKVIKLPIMGKNKCRFWGRATVTSKLPCTIFKFGLLHNGEDLISHWILKPRMLRLQVTFPEFEHKVINHVEKCTYILMCVHCNEHCNNIHNIYLNTRPKFVDF